MNEFDETMKYELADAKGRPNVRHPAALPACVICGGAIAEGELAEMYRRVEDEAEEGHVPESGFVHAECGLAAGWEVS